jgi:glycosyltransferase involved in cell wall biosynthesis
MFGWEFPPYISGGLGTACHGLATGLRAEGVDITLVLPQTPHEGLSGIDFLRASDVSPLTENEQLQKRALYRDFEELIEVDACIHPYFSEDEYQFQKSRVLQLSQDQKRDEYECGSTEVGGEYGESLFVEVSRFARVGTRLGIRGDFDLVYAHDWMTMLAGVEASHQSGAPLVVHVHSTEYDRSYSSPDASIVAIEAYALQKATHIITVSNRSKDILVDKYALDVDKISVIYNAVHAPQSKALETHVGFKEKLILFMGRITEQKGPEYFIRAAKKVLQRRTDVRFIMAGCGDQLPRMIEYVAAERMERHFHFTGFLRDQEIAQMFSLCDLFVMPSVSEPFGITPLEAMSFGVPAIVSKQSGVAEILSHALKVDFWDVDALADSIEQALADAMLGARSALEVEHLGWDIPARKLKTLFTAMVKERTL